MKTFDEALSYLMQKVSVTTETEIVDIKSALGRVLAEDVVSEVNVPPHDNSMMDGYAVHSYDLSHDTCFEVSQRIPAGSKGEPLKAGTIARIFTGAPIPEGADLVIMQEETEQHGDRVKITASKTVKGQNIRLLGEDIRQGSTILSKGHKLKAQDLGLITSIGIGEVKVYRPLKVATFTTGSELLEPGEQAQEGKIYNANRYIFTGLLAELNMELIDLGRVEDTLQATIEAMQAAAQQADIVLTSGGVSVGEEDHIKPAIEQLGGLDMWKVKMKPGKPLAYGHIADTPFIGLPGNPVSAFATFMLFARPYLLKMQGATEVYPKPIWLEAGFEWNKPGFRREFARAQLVSDLQAKNSQVILYSNQGSGVLTSTVWAEGFVVIPEDKVVKKGDKVAFYPFKQINS